MKLPLKELLKRVERPHFETVPYHNIKGMKGNKTAPHHLPLGQFLLMNSLNDNVTATCLARE